MTDFLDKVIAVVGAAHVIHDPDIARSFTTDWTGRFSGDTPAVVRPGSRDELCEVLALCNRDRIALVPQGGNTGLVGGSVPTQGEVVLSLTRLAGIQEPELDVDQVTAAAGATLAELQAVAAANERGFGVDLSARDSATIGGMVATNAGGLKAVRYGPMRRQLVGVEVVLADGSVITDLLGLPKDNSGYHLPSLLCGSEGTLGIVTKARLALTPTWPHRATALIALRSMQDAVTLANAVRQRLRTLEALEFMLPDAIDLVIEHAGVPAPFPATAGVYLLLEVAAVQDPSEILASFLESDEVLDATLAADPEGRRRLWTYRDRVTEAISATGIPHKLDVAVPLHAIPEFLDQVQVAVAQIEPRETASVVLFGHLGDGNVHVNVLGVEDRSLIDDAVLRLAASFGGSISAEHGIGTAKRQWLHLRRGADEIRAFRAIKSALDPNHILNPNVLLPA